MAVLEGKGRLAIDPHVESLITDQVSLYILHLSLLLLRHSRHSKPQRIVINDSTQMTANLRKEVRTKAAIVSMAPKMFLAEGS